MSTSLKRGTVKHFYRGNATADVSDKTDYRTISSKFGGSSEDRPVGLFHSIEKTISMLPTLPEDDENYLCPEAAKKAILILSALRHANMPPPRIIPEDADALSFTWDSLFIKRFLTVALDEVDITHVHRPTRKRARRTVFVGEKIQPRELFTAIGAAPINKSLSVEE
ncbi:MAG: hypothetical protein QNK42_09135 [Pseudodonghicola sp.]|nr:hypothetical protein [Pseudodonghicola sp.]